MLIEKSRKLLNKLRKVLVEGIWQQVLLKTEFYFLKKKSPKDEI